ncbi:MAG TPA: hypothetical protein PKC21_06750 [Oligoflexia bacterium]|nr:hypothetical protein [Oligoflexia bacterium]HMR25035.1 hypothetical protein [Oligoflexia bacterium]
MKKRILLSILALSTAFMHACGNSNQALNLENVAWIEYHLDKLNQQALAAADIDLDLNNKVIAGKVSKINSSNEHCFIFNFMNNNELQILKKTLSSLRYSLEPDTSTSCLTIYTGIEYINVRDNDKIYFYHDCPINKNVARHDTEHDFKEFIRNKLLQLRNDQPECNN